MGRPVKGVGSNGLGEFVWVMRSPRGEWCFTTVIRPGDYFVQNFPNSRLITLYVNNVERYY